MKLGIFKFEISLLKAKNQRKRQALIFDKQVRDTKSKLDEILEKLSYGKLSTFFQTQFIRSLTLLLMLLFLPKKVMKGPK